MYRDVNKGIVLPCAYVLTLTFFEFFRITNCPSSPQISAVFIRFSFPTARSGIKIMKKSVSSYTGILRNHPKEYKPSGNNWVSLPQPYFYGSSVLPSVRFSALLLLSQSPSGHVRFPFFACLCLFSGNICKTPAISA